MQRQNTTYAILSGIALVAWMACGSLFYADQCCTAVTNESYAGQLLIQDGADFKVQHNEVIAFPKNSAQLILSEQLSEELFKVVRYVKSNPIKRVTIVGLYLGAESEGADLGKARAEAMRKVFIESGTPPYQIRTEIGRQDDLLEDETGTVVLEGIDFIFDCLAPFEIGDPTYRFSLKAEDNLVFDYNSVQFLMPLSKLMEVQMKEIATYLQTHSDRQLKITGYNHPDETHYGVLQNLGLARANAVRNLLLQAGTSPYQLLVDGISEERLAVESSDLYDQFLPNALGFKFEALSKNRVQALKRKIATTEEALKKRQVFRFKDFGLEEEKIVVDEELKIYIQELILYLSSRPKAAVFVVGHSNTLATKAESGLKGKERANYVRDFLVEQGISITQINTTTAGDSHPLGKRETRYGQQINRRVDLFLSADGKEPQLYALPPILPEETVTKKKKKRPQSPPKTTPVDTSKTTTVPPATEETVTPPVVEETTKEDAGAESTTVTKDSVQ